jgi:hypothetical protein
LIFLSVLLVVRSTPVYICLVILIKLRSVYWLLRDHFYTFHSPCSVSWLLAVTTAHLISSQQYPQSALYHPAMLAFRGPISFTLSGLVSVCLIPVSRWYCSNYPSLIHAIVSHHDHDSYQGSAGT